MFGVGRWATGIYVGKWDNTVSKSDFSCFLLVVTEQRNENKMLSRNNAHVVMARADKIVDCLSLASEWKRSLDCLSATCCKQG